MQAGCSAVHQLSRTCPASALELYDERLVSGLLAVLSHQHSRVRVTALHALSALILKVSPGHVVIMESGSMDLLAIMRLYLDSKASW